jgi:chromosome segregation ATPase
MGERHSLDEAIAQLQTKLETTRTQLEESAQSTQNSLSSIGEQSSELMVALEGANESSVLAYENLRTRTEDVEAQISEGLQVTQDYLLQQLDSDIVAYETELEQQVDEMRACIQDMCLPEITGKVEGFLEHADMLTEQVTSYLGDLQENTEQSVAGALDVFQSAHDEQLSDLLGTAGEVSSFLTELSESVIGRLGEIQNTMESLGTVVSTTNTGAEAAIGTLEDVIDLLTLDF